MTPSKVSFAGRFLLMQENALEIVTSCVRLC